MYYSVWLWWWVADTQEQIDIRRRKADAVVSKYAGAPALKMYFLIKIYNLKEWERREQSKIMDMYHLIFCLEGWIEWNFPTFKSYSRQCWAYYNCWYHSVFQI